MATKAANNVTQGRNPGDDADHDLFNRLQFTSKISFNQIKLRDAMVNCLTLAGRKLMDKFDSSGAKPGKKKILDDLLSEMVALKGKLPEGVSFRKLETLRRIQSAAGDDSSQSQEERETFNRRVVIPSHNTLPPSISSAWIQPSSRDTPPAFSPPEDDDVSYSGEIFLPNYENKKRSKRSID